MAHNDPADLESNPIEAMDPGEEHNERPDPVEEDDLDDKDDLGYDEDDEDLEDEEDDEDEDEGE